MTTVEKIGDAITKKCPLNLAFDRDNVGLLVGSRQSEVKKVLITLDVDELVVKEAVQKGANLIVSHHPLMFHPIQRLTDTDSMQRTLMALIKHDISLYSAHTNMDCAFGGLNDYLAQKLGIENCLILDVTTQQDKKDCGFGRIGFLREETTLGEILHTVVRVLNIDGVKYVGDVDRKVKKIAVNCGGGAYAVDLCLKNDVDLFITGDVKHNEARDAMDAGMALIDAGHYETEHIVIDLFYSMLCDQFKDVEFIKSEANTPVFHIFVK